MEPATMRIVDGAFVPPLVFAHAGGPVTIVNLDRVAHSLTDAGALSVSILGGGGTYSFSAPHSGTLSFICDGRALVKGQIFIVEERGVGRGRRGWGPDRPGWPTSQSNVTLRNEAKA